MLELMSDDSKNILEAIEEEAAEAAKAVVADVKSIAAEVAGAIAECKAELCHPSKSGSLPVEKRDAAAPDNPDGQANNRPSSTSAS